MGVFFVAPPACSPSGQHLSFSCLVSLECTLGGLFLAHAAAGLPYTVPCRASHPHGQGDRVICT